MDFAIRDWRWTALGYRPAMEWPGELLRRDVVFGVLAVLFKDQQQSGSS